MEQQTDHSRMSAQQYRVKDAELVRQEAAEELAEWRKISAQRDRKRHEPKSRVSTSRTA